MEKVSLSFIWKAWNIRNSWPALAPNPKKPCKKKNCHFYTSAPVKVKINVLINLKGAGYICTDRLQ